MLPNYRRAAHYVVVWNEIIHVSTQWISLQWMRYNIPSWPPVVPILNTLVALLQCVWPKEYGGSKEAADNAVQFHGSVPGVASSCFLPGGIQLHNSLGWQRPFLNAALQVLSAWRTSPDFALCWQCYYTELRGASIASASYYALWWSGSPLFSSPRSPLRLLAASTWPRHGSLQLRPFQSRLTR